MCSVSLSTSIVDPFNAGAFIDGLPSPFAPWQTAHFA